MILVDAKEEPENLNLHPKRQRAWTNVGQCKNDLNVSVRKHLSLVLHPDLNGPSPKLSGVGRPDGVLGCVLTLVSHDGLAFTQ